MVFVPVQQLNENTVVVITVCVKVFTVYNTLYKTQKSWRAVVNSCLPT